MHSLIFWQENSICKHVSNLFPEHLCTHTYKIPTRYKILDGFIAFSWIQLYTYRTLFTYRHARYLSSLWDIIQYKTLFSCRHCPMFKIITKYDKHMRYYSPVCITYYVSSLQNMISYALLCYLAHLTQEMEHVDHLPCATERDITETNSLPCKDTMILHWTVWLEASDIGAQM